MLNSIRFTKLCPHPPPPPPPGMQNLLYHNTKAPPEAPINIQTQVSNTPTNEAAIEGFVIEEGVAAAAVAMVEEVLEDEEAPPPTGPPVPLALTVSVQVDTETPVLFLHGPGEAEDLKVMSAQLYNPPFGSPLVTTWIVAVVPSLMFRDEGMG